jgi:nitrogen fixation protein NifU and related proteins
MQFYSEKVMDHFTNPRNVGEVSDPDGVGQVGNPVCGDIMKFTIKVEDGRLADVKFRTFGCGAAIAVSSIVSEMATGKTLEEALQITNRDVARELEGLPGNKMHCSNLGADALRLAIEDYLAKRAEKPTGDEEPAAIVENPCECPFCDQEACPGAAAESAGCRAEPRSKRDRLP